jgi:hypothetical protein
MRPLLSMIGANQRHHRTTNPTLGFYFEYDEGLRKT